ncbi:unnamed protein product, partial [Meganyctiphanes norvegica]
MTSEVTIQCDSNVGKSLQWLRGRGGLCDVVIKGYGGQKASGHSCVLAPSSTVVAALLQGRLTAGYDWSIQHDDSGINVMELLLSLIYGEMIRVTEKLLEPLLQYATMLGLSKQIAQALQHLTGEGQHNKSGKLTPSGRNGRAKQRRKPVLTKDNCEIRTNYTEVNDVPANNMPPSPALELRLDTEILPDIENNANEKGNNNDLLIDETGGTEMCDMLGTCDELELPGITNQSSHQNTLSLTDMEVDDRLLPTNDYDSKEDIQRLKKEGLLVSHCSEDLVSESERNEHVHENHQVDEITIHNNLVEDSSNELLELVDKEYPQEEYFMDAQHFNRQQQQQIPAVEAPQQNKTVGKGLLCTVCNSTFQRVIDLVKHVLHSLHYTPQCPLCTFQDDVRENQRVHFEKHDDKYPFFCVYCDLRFRTKAALNMHLPKHMSTKPFVCHQCGRGFKWRHALLAHLQTHNPPHHLLCDICGFSSKTQTTFKVHLLKHSDRARYPCPYTGCVFKTHRKINLNAHLATHSKERSHQCEVCGHSFSHAKNLRRHMRLHEPASHFLHCSQILSSGSRCSFRTTRPDKLRYHLLKKHYVKDNSVATNKSSSIHMESNKVQTVEQSEKEIVQKNSPIMIDLQNLPDTMKDIYVLLDKSQQDYSNAMELMSQKNEQVDNLSGMVSDLQHESAADTTVLTEGEGSEGTAAATPATTTVAVVDGIHTHIPDNEIRESDDDNVDLNTSAPITTAAAAAAAPAAPPAAAAPAPAAAAGVLNNALHPGHHHVNNMERAMMTIQMQIAVSKLGARHSDIQMEAKARCRASNHHLQHKSFTFISEMRPGDTSWLDHCISTQDGHNIINNMFVNYQLSCRDHVPLVISLCIDKLPIVEDEINDVT